MGISLSPNCARLRKLGGYFTKMGNCDLEVSDVQADFGEILQVGEVSASMQERRKNRTNAIDGGVANLEDMFMS